MPSQTELRIPPSLAATGRGAAARMRAAAARLTTVSALVLAVSAAGTARAQDVAEVPRGTSGPYLAARLASATDDYAAAARYYAEALHYDPRNPALLEAAVVSTLGAGDVEAALPFAQALEGKGSQIANLVLVSGQVKAGDFAAVLAGVGADPGAGPLVDGLLTAWAEVGRGQMSEATAAFDRVGQLRGMETFGYYHKALALALAGDFENAEVSLTAPQSAPLRLTRRGTITEAEILSQLDRNADALALLDRHFSDDPDPELDRMRAALEAGEALPFTAVSSAQDGIAEVFYTVAAALSGNAKDATALAYARLSDYLRGDSVEPVLLIAAILEAQGQYALATEAYNRIPREDPSYPIAELGRADALVSAGRSDAAIEALEQLARGYPKQAAIWATLGDTLRREERWAEAAKAYDAAVALLQDGQPGSWQIYYARGICLERMGDADKSEADLRKALELQPDQPQVLNYLGYSFLELGRNLDEALGMIQRAVDARPQDGYIVDSLGWAYYRLGRYQDAVPTMEEAVALMSTDPVINDHLGDVYWAVGRQREAQFQWRRALSFKPEEPGAADRIRRKLEVGLDKVLAEEGAKPLNATEAEGTAAGKTP